MSESENSFGSFKVVIQAGHSSAYWKSILEFYELLFVFARRDISVRYKQTTIGVLWALIKPVFTMVAFTIVFQKIAKLPSFDIPYPLMVFSGLIPWFFFSTAVSEMANSLVSNQHIVSKVYFPRILLPLSAIFVGLVDYIVSCLLLIPLMIFLSMPLSWHLSGLLPATFLACLNCAALGIFLAALNVSYRDVRHAIPFLVQFGLYISPVGFLTSVIPEQWRILYSINPIVGTIDLFRWAVSAGKVEIYWPAVVISIVFSTILFVMSIFYFRKVERTLADII